MAEDQNNQVDMQEDVVEQTSENVVDSVQPETGVAETAQEVVEPDAAEVQSDSGAVLDSKQEVEAIEPPTADSLEQELNRARTGQLTPQERFEAKRAEMQAFENSLNAGMPRQVKPEDVFRELDKEDAAAQKRAQEQDQELKSRLNERRQVIEEAQKRGIQLPPDPELDPILQDQAEKVSQLEAVEAKTQEKAAKNQQVVQQELANVQAEVQKEDDIRRGTAEILREAFERQEKESQVILEKLAQEDEELKEIGSESFFERQNTFGKIATGIALALGTAATAGGSRRARAAGSQALDIINNSIDRDLQTQKINREAKLAKKKRALELARMQLGQVSQRSKNAMAIAEAERLDQKLAAEQDKVDAQRQFMKQVGIGGAVDRDLVLQDKELGKRIVSIPGDPMGKVRIANRPEAAKAIEDAQSEILPDLKNLAEIKRLAKEIDVIEKLNPADPRIGVLEGRMTKLRGGLRLPFTGPGVLTDAEYERLTSATGDPAAFLKFPRKEMAKLLAVEDILKSTLNQRYRTGGLEPPISKREKLIRQMLQKNPSYTREQVERNIDKLQKAGKLKD